MRRSGARGPGQETRSRKRARGGCSLATRPGSGKRRMHTERLFSTERYQFQMPSLKGSDQRGAAAEGARMETL